MLDGNLQQRACGTRRLPAPLLPVLKSPCRHAQQLRELLLRQADAGPCFGRRRQLDLRNAHGFASPHLLDRSQQVSLKLLNFRSHLQPPLQLREERRRQAISQGRTHNPCACDATCCRRPAMSGLHVVDPGTEWTSHRAVLLAGSMRCTARRPGSAATGSDPTTPWPSCAARSRGRHGRNATTRWGCRQSRPPPSRRAAARAR